jgi:hypothetical protein
MGNKIEKLADEREIKYLINKYYQNIDALNRLDNAYFYNFVDDKWLKGSNDYSLRVSCYKQNKKKITKENEKIERIFKENNIMYLLNEKPEKIEFTFH